MWLAKGAQCLEGIRSKPREGSDSWLIHGSSFLSPENHPSGWWNVASRGAGSWERGAQGCDPKRCSCCEFSPSHPHHWGQGQRKGLSSGWINVMKTGSSCIIIYKPQLLFRVKRRCALSQNSAEAGLWSLGREGLLTSTHPCAWEGWGN